VIVFVQHQRASKARRLVLRGPFSNFLIPTFCLSPAGILMVAATTQASYSYGIAGQLVSSEDKARAAESGVNAFGRCSYDPLSLFERYLGYLELTIVGVLFGLLVLLVVVARLAPGEAFSDNSIGRAAGQNRNRVDRAFGCGYLSDVYRQHCQIAGSWVVIGIAGLATRYLRDNLLG